MGLKEFEKDISIIIVNYNVKDFLFKCLKSIEIASINLNIETIVVDNNSTDGSTSFLKNKFPSVKFIQNSENLGFAKANNIGFNLASGKYYLILNPDTILSEDTLQVMFDYMELNQKTGIAGCKVLNPDGTFQVQCRRGFPTPWASFCKLFGLQTLFPKSKLFAQYNQTFRSIDETYQIDAVIGAFMFARADVIKQTGGFDEDYFMYGEDLDLCYRVKKIGYNIVYNHSTTIIHYKGESTKRSNINDVKHFYNAMQIYAQKHYKKSYFFLTFIKVGIVIREIIAYLLKSGRDTAIILLDLLFLNLSLIIATKIRFGDFFGFPDYAYPAVFIWTSAIVFFAMVFIGEYFDSRHTIRRYIFGLLISFFGLSVLMYFFQNYAFSRGLLVLMIALSMLFSSIIRSVYYLLDKIVGNDADKRIVFIGDNSNTKEIINNLSLEQSTKFIFLGLIKTEFDKNEISSDLPVIGHLNKLNQIINENDIDEVIITEPNISNSDLITILQNNTDTKARFHLVNHFEDLLTSRILNDISGEITTLPKYNINILRYRILKRLFDIFFSILLILALLPLSVFANKKRLLKSAFKILTGEKSFIGLFSNKNDLEMFKEGLTGLVHISNPQMLNENTISKLNEYYVRNYTLSLDLDIILKLIFRK